MTMSKDIIQLTAGGGVLYQDSSLPHKVLLMKRNGVWDLPKGKIEEDESIEECAVREVEEEVGAKNLTLGKFLCDTYHEFEEKGQKFGKTTSWYSMKYLENGLELVPEKDEGITDLKWVELRKAKIMVEFENLVEVLSAFEKQIDRS